MKKTCLLFLSFCLILSASVWAGQLPVLLSGSSTQFLQGSGTITSVMPDSAMQGQTLQVTISGSQTLFIQGSTTSWLTRGIDAILPSVNIVNSTTQMQSIYSIPNNAAIGLWDLNVQDACGVMTLTDGFRITLMTSNDPRSELIEQSLKLAPNPVIDEFTLEYSFPLAENRQPGEHSKVAVEILDMQGRLVRSLFEGEQQAGEHRLKLSLGDIDLPAGAFFVVLHVDDMWFAEKAIRIH